MYPALLFHSFDNNINSDKFYDLSIREYISLIDFLGKNIDPKNLTITFDDGFKSIIPAIEYALRKGYKTIAYIITDFVEKEGFLSIKDIQYLNRIGCEIGSHSKSHRDLKKVDKKLLHIELIESKKFLENIIGNEIIHFSFPYGSHNKFLINKVRSIYKFNAISRPNFFNQKNLIGRISVTSLNCKKHAKILQILNKKLSYKYVLRLFLSFILKKLLPNKFYIFLKNIISINKSKDVFKIKYNIIIV